MDSEALTRLKDRYTPAEIVEKLEIDDDTFFDIMGDYILDNMEMFEEENDI